MAPKTNFLWHQEERPFPVVLSCRSVVKEARASASSLQKWIEDWITGVSQ